MTSYLYIKSPLLFNPNKLQKEVQEIIHNLISKKELEKDWESITLSEVSLQEDSYLSYVLSFFDAPKESIEIKKVFPSQEAAEVYSHEANSGTVSIYIPINAPGNSIGLLSKERVNMASGECWIIPQSTSFSTLYLPQIHLSFQLSQNAWTEGFISIGTRDSRSTEPSDLPLPSNPREFAKNPSNFNLLPRISNILGGGKLG